MGNAIEKKYDAPKEHTATAGHLQLWKIWPGKSKDASGKLVSIWAFDKSEILAGSKGKDGKPMLNNIQADKAVVEQIYQVMKKDLAVMKDSQACSSLISTIEVIEESKNNLVFTTERIVCSLADILNNFDYIPGGYIHHADFFEGNSTVSEMEISRSLLMLTEGLQFMHNVQRRLHLNITPDGIVITASGHWKLCGFGFSLSFQQGDLQRIASPYFLKPLAPVAGGSFVRLEPDLRYAAPEITDGGYNPAGVRYLGPASDSFSLAMVLYEIYRFNLKMQAHERASFRSFLTIVNNDVGQHTMALEVMKFIDYSFLPPGIDRLLVGLLALNPSTRLTTNDVVNNAYFVTGNQAIINSVEKLHTRDIGTQTSQLIALQGQLHDFPPRLLKFTVLPALGKLCGGVPSLWEYALPIFEMCATIVGKESFQLIAGQHLAAGLTNNTSTEAMQAFLLNIDFVKEYLGASFIQLNGIILFCNALEKQHSLLQNIVFEKLWDENVAASLEGSLLAERLVPQLCKEACKNTDSNIKIQALFVLSRYISKLDKQFVVANILPSMKYITDNDRSPTVTMHVMGLYEAISDSLGAEYVASSIMPAVLPMVVDRTLDRRQFETVVGLVKSLSKKMTEPRTQELGMPPISFGEINKENLVDPFGIAKQILTTTRNTFKPTTYDPNASNFDKTHGLTRLGAVPPAPLAPPPPPPSLPPPPPPSSLPQPLPQGGLYNASTSTKIPDYSASSTSDSILQSSSYASPFSGQYAPPTAPLSTPATLSTSAFPGYSPASVAPTSTGKPEISTAGFGSNSSSNSPNPSSSTAKAGGGFTSWFSSSKPKPAGGEKEAEYQPPILPAGGSAPATGTSGMSADIDLDDFMNSLGQSKKTAAPQSTVNPPAYTPPMQPQTMSPYSVPTAPLSLEQQLKQTQDQISKLSANLTPAPQTSYTPATPAYVAPVASNNMQAKPSYSNPTPPYGGAPSYASPSSSSAGMFNQAPTPSTYPTSSTGIGSSSNVYNPPVGSNSSIPSYSMPSTQYTPPSTISATGIGSAANVYSPPVANVPVANSNNAGSIPGFSRASNAQMSSAAYVPPSAATYTPPQTNAMPNYGGMNQPSYSAPSYGQGYAAPQQYGNMQQQQQQQPAYNMPTPGYSQQGMYGGGQPQMMPSYPANAYNMPAQGMPQQQQQQAPQGAKKNQIDSAFDFLS